MARGIVAGAGLLAATLANAAVLELTVIQQNTYSSVQFAIGSPAKNYRLRFDTGSSSSWIVNSDCVFTTECPNFSGYSRVGYNPVGSSTAQRLGPYSKIPYIDGDGVGGDAYQDLFAAKTSDNQTVSWNQTFLSANHSSWRFITADGFLGLGFSSIAETNTSSLVETLMQQGDLDEPRFGLFYGTKNTNSGDNPDGVLSIGGSKEDVYVDGEVRYVPLRVESPYQLWRTPLRSVVVTTGDNQSSNTTTIPVSNQQASTGIGGPKNTTLPVIGGRLVFDTGAGRVSLPSEVIGDVYTALGWNITKLRNGSEHFTCEALNSTWAINLVVGDGDPANDVSFEMRGNEFVSDRCMPPLDDSGVKGFSLIGSAFLKRYYSIYDFGSFDVESYQPRLGFGRLKKEYDFLYL